MNLQQQQAAGRRRSAKSKHYMDWIEAKYSYISIKNKTTGPKWSHLG